MDSHSRSRHLHCYNTVFTCAGDSWIFMTSDLVGAPPSLQLKRGFSVQPHIYRVRYIKCYRSIALKLLIISKNVSDKNFSVREDRHATAITRSLTKPHRKKSGNVRSDERGGQATGPPRPIHFSSKISSITCLEHRA